MATVRMTIEEAAAVSSVDREKLDATTEEDIRRHMVEDGFDPDDPFRGLRRVLSPSEIRRRAGLTQVAIAERLNIPVRTWRNWEQGRGALEPATRSLLNILSVHPEMVFEVLSGFRPAPPLQGQSDRAMQEDDALIERMPSGPV